MALAYCIAPTPPKPKTLAGGIIKTGALNSQHGSAKGLISEPGSKDSRGRLLLVIFLNNLHGGPQIAVDFERRNAGRRAPEVAEAKPFLCSPRSLTLTRLGQMKKRVESGAKIICLHVALSGLRGMRSVRIQSLVCSSGVRPPSRISSPIHQKITPSFAREKPQS
jgi:hypothetical protein